jgi:hypothetical protein
MERRGPRWLAPGECHGLLDLDLDKPTGFAPLLGRCRGTPQFPDAPSLRAILRGAGLSLLLGTVAFARQRDAAHTGR